MNWETINRYSTLVIAGLTSVMFGYVMSEYISRPKIEISSIKKLVREAGEAEWYTPETLQKKTLQDKKRERLLNLPSISLHYADKERIKNFYNDYFREPTTESLVKEVISEASGEASAKLPEILESKMRTKDLSKWIETVKLPETSIDGMFRRYQRETIKNNQVSLDLDVVDVELSNLDAFDSLTKKLESEYGFQLEP